MYTTYLTLQKVLIDCVILIIFNINGSLVNTRLYI